MANSSDENAEKDTKDWVTGDEPITGPQQSYIETLNQETGEHVDTDGLTKADASEKIDELQQKREERQSAGNDSQDIAAETDPDLREDEAA